MTNNPDLEIKVYLCTMGYQIDVCMNGQDIFSRCRDIVDDLDDPTRIKNVQLEIAKELIESAQRVEKILGNIPLNIKPESYIQREDVIKLTEKSDLFDMLNEEHIDSE